ncbi:MAG TPA: hypothetical protein VHW60_17425 [Caulobacteraceae bacterium]|jgi:hypothetical protein|nr:hypothetical protein [Caulobacteraceae bacterium]
MSLDFGSVRRARGELSVIRTMAIVSALVFGGAGAGWLYTVWSHQTGDARAETKAWLVTGPPCPTITADAWRALDIANPQPASFRGIVAERDAGDVTCETQDVDAAGHAVAPYPVCRFGSPVAIHLITPRGDLYFQPPVGSAATVTLAGGQPRCMLAAAGASWSTGPYGAAQ